MSKDEKKLQKRRSRAKAVKAGLRTQRDAERRRRKREREGTVEEASFRKTVNKRVQLEQWAAALGDKLPADVRRTVLHNIEILKELEAEHQREVSTRKELRERLQSEGHETLPDMINALNAKMRAGDLGEALGMGALAGTLSETEEVPLAIGREPAGGDL